MIRIKRNFIMWLDCCIKNYLSLTYITYNINVMLDHLISEKMREMRVKDKPLHHKELHTLCLEQEKHVFLLLARSSIKSIIQPSLISTIRLPVSALLKQISSTSPMTKSTPAFISSITSQLRIRYHTANTINLPKKRISSTLKITNRG